jgi:A/G-specific adenine glycosylase
MPRASSPEPIGSSRDRAPRRLASIKRRLLDWYGNNKRDLPWRRTSDPYRILLSEFMLQQTQVDTVIPYYHRFIERFPSVRVLADAPQAEVLKVWEGLGYYSRARNLHKAAGLICERFEGSVPQSYDDLASLPGFGPYTTAAVLSIAFDRDHAVLDGNVIRVLARLFGVDEDVTQTTVKSRLQALAQSLLNSQDAGDFNQAVMELGATVCTPRAPQCSACPVGRFCAAARSGQTEDLPVKRRRAARPHRVMAVGIVSRKGRLLIVKRPENGLLGGLWEFPAGVRADDESLQECCVSAVKEQVGIAAEVTERFRTVEHAFTHFSVTMHAFLCRSPKGRIRALACADAAWVPAGDLSEYAVSRANRKLIDYLQQDPDLAR